MMNLREISEARVKLRRAEALIAAVRGMFLVGGHYSGARISNDILGLVFDAIRGLDAFERRMKRGKP
jgi:hypothetical protein